MIAANDVPLIDRHNHERLCPRDLALHLCTLRDQLRTLTLHGPLPPDLPTHCRPQPLAVFIPTPTHTSARGADDSTTSDTVRLHVQGPASHDLGHACGVLGAGAGVVGKVVQLELGCAGEEEQIVKRYGVCFNVFCVSFPSRIPYIHIGVLSIF